MAKWSYDPGTEDFKGDDLYFIREGEDGPVKIGRGDTPKRLRRLQTGNPRKLSVIGILPNQGYTEAFWHEGFLEYRLEGEWFSPERRLLAAIRAALAGKDWPRFIPWGANQSEQRELRPHLLDAFEIYQDEVFDGASERKAVVVAYGHLLDIVMAPIREAAEIARLKSAVRYPVNQIGEE